MKKRVARVVVGMYIVGVSMTSAAAPAKNSDAAKRDAAINAIHVESSCQQAILSLSYAMPYAYNHGVSQADAVAKMQTVASDQNKPLVRHMAILAYGDGTSQDWKSSAKSYCMKQLGKRPPDDDDLGLLDGGNAMTLFQH
jgi:hypothetical protein